MPPTPAIHCAILTQPSFFARRRIRAIYDANFPPAQRKPFDYLLHGVRSGDITLFVARDSAARNRIVSVAILAPLSDTSAWYLGYLATDPARHNQGLGGQLFDAVIAHLNAVPDADALVWEVDAPPPDATGDASRIENRRICFYERHGAHVIPQSRVYRVPDDKSAGGTVPQRLMWTPTGTELAETHVLPCATIAAWIAAIFRDVYIDAADLAAAIIAALPPDA